MRVLVMSLLLGLTACGGASPDIVASFQEEDTGSLPQEAQVSDTVRDDTMSPPVDAGPEAVIADVVTEVGDVAVEAEVSPDTALVDDTSDTSTIDSFVADTEMSVIDSSSDTSAVEVSDTNSVDTFTPPVDSGTDTFVADTYVPPIDTAPVCMYASNTSVTTGDASAVMLNGTFMCYEMMIRTSKTITVTETIMVTSNVNHMKISVAGNGMGIIMAVSTNLAFSPSLKINDGKWHKVSACKVAESTGKYYKLQVSVDGIAGAVSSSYIPLDAIITPGSLNFGWSGDYDKVVIFKQDGTTLARWNMDGNADDSGPTKLSAMGTPTYTAMTCP